MAAALVVGTHLAARRRQSSARVIAGSGMLVAALGATLLPRATSGGSYVLDLLPGLVVVGVGAGLVFVAVSDSVMAGIPAMTRAWPRGSSSPPPCAAESMNAARPQTVGLSGVCRNRQLRGRWPP
jgi:hypothetical protein